MKRILGLIRQDVRLALRDSIVIYIALGPLLMALALSLFMPSVENASLTFAVEKSIEADYVSELSRYGNVEIYENSMDVTERVERLDMVPGVIYDGGRIAVLFEGNEAGSLIENCTAVISQAFSGSNPLEYNITNLDSGSSFVREILTLLIVMTSIFLGGVASGFNIVGEKDSKSLCALGVSPLKMHEFVTARGLLAFAVSTVTVLAGSLIMSGMSVNYMMLIMLLFSSCTVTSLVSLIIGRLAGNQINAISAIKFAMPVFLTIPIASLFLPRTLQFLLYPFPNYWQFRALRCIYAGSSINTEFLVSCLMTFIIGTALLVILSRTLKKHFGIR